MPKNLDIFSAATLMAQHAGQRQAIVSQNIANADTPDYRAKDLVPFSEEIDNHFDEPKWQSTRQGHFNIPHQALSASGAVVSDNGYMEPNGNSVSLASEMARAAEIEKQHTRAITVYKHAMQIMRTSLGKM